MMSPLQPSFATPSPHSFVPQPQDEYSSTAAATAAAALSQHIPSPGANTQNGRKRKASGFPGSRGVANLTPDQLAKKRANDREAQRAIRERTKNTIEGLEQKIQDLESQQPFQELQKVAQERDRALAECEQLRNKLAMVQSVIESPLPPPQSQPNLHELAALTAQQSPLPPLNAQHTPPYSQNGASQPSEHQNLHPELRSPQSETRSTPASQPATNGPTYQSNGTSLHRWSSIVDQSQQPQFGLMNGMSFEARLPPPAAMLENGSSNGERLGLDYVLEPKQHSASTSPSTQGPACHTPHSGPETPFYARLPNVIGSTCPLDLLLGNFLSNCQEQIRNGVPMKDVLGPDYPDFNALREVAPVSSGAAHPVSKLLIDIISKFPGISALPERVAVLYIMFLVMRWMICPCEDCYERVPGWIRPLQEQLEVPHPAWNDYVPWPFIRLRLMTGAEVKFEDFFEPFTRRMCVNWPYQSDHVLIRAAVTDDASTVNINPAFESHLRDLRNWSLSSAFKTEFPQLVDQRVRFED